MTAESKYAYKQPERTDDLVEVTVPSGNTFLFHKPSKFAVLFTAGNLPQMATSQAVEEWAKEGVIPEGVNGVGIAPADQQTLIKTVFELRDKVLKLCVSPKMVIGKAQEGEVSTDDIADEDLEYLFKWVAAGGDAAAMAAMFPQGAFAGPVVRPNRKARRTKASQVSRAN